MVNKISSDPSSIQTPLMEQFVRETCHVIVMKRWKFPIPVKNLKVSAFTVPAIHVPTIHWMLDIQSSILSPSALDEMMCSR